MKPYIDMHCDTISAMNPEENLATARGHINLDKLEAGGCRIQNFACYLDAMETKNLYTEGMALVKRFLGEMECFPDRIVQVRSAEDIRRICGTGKPAADAAGKTSAADTRIGGLLTLEEGEICGGSLEKLREFYDLGVRMITLTWNFPNSIGYPNVSFPEIPGVDYEQLKEPQYQELMAQAFMTPNTKDGLTPFGKEFVREMQRLGMIVDVSHLSDAGFYDVAELVDGPFVASHSDARAVCNCVRNLTDDMIRVLAEHGGVTGLNFCEEFLDEENGGTIEKVIQHAKHIVNVGGIEVLGLGTDFDGIEGHKELYDAAQMPRLYDALVASGFSEDDADKIFFGNVLRVYTDVLR